MDIRSERHDACLRLYPAGEMTIYSAAELNPVDGRGLYLPSTPPAGGVVLAGAHIWKANELIVPKE